MDDARAALTADLLRLRRALRLSQSQMAAALNISLRQYQRWEHGTSAPRARELARIADALVQLAPGNGRNSAFEVERALGELGLELDALRAEVARLRALMAAHRA